jgi:VWFA-related protein
MKSKLRRRHYHLLLTLILAAGTTSYVDAQQTEPQTPDVVKVNTELVQTAVTVVDKDGRFVPGLDRDKFQLLIDGKPRSISSFDRISGGNPAEAKPGSSIPADTTAAKPVGLSTLRGRTVVFFIDDMHMAADSLHRTREMLRRFVTNEMSMADTTVITTASGQIGFLEQFTNNKQVLSSAIDRLSPRQYEVRSFGTGSTQMREFDALIIDTTESKKVNSEVLNYYIRECVVQSNPPKQIPIARAAIAMSCETEVRNSARAVLIQTAKITQNMYASLESLMRSAAKSPGRKIAFFISDGFLLDAGPHAPDLRGNLDNIIDGAQKAGVVVYSIDSRGLVNDAVDVRQGNARMDFGAPIGEMEAHQDAMNALAGDTGGRALRNTNYFDRWVTKVMDEASNYYLLAWRPDTEAERAPKFRQVQISIVNRPDLTVRAPRGYLSGPVATALTVTEKPPANHATRTPETELREALSAHYASRGLPTFLSLTFLNTPKNEMLLTSSIQVGTNSLDYGGDRKQPATLRLAGVILNDKGKVAGSFKNQLTVNPIEALSDSAGIIYNERTSLLPGIYQVRVAARDEKSGRVGSALQWIVIPDLAKPELTTSSILLGAQVVANKQATENAQIQMSVDHSFRRSSRLGYWIFIYKAKRGANGGPNVSVQSAVQRDGRTLLNGPVRKIVNGGDDVERIPFGDELPLQSLAPGKYELTVTVKDEIAGTTTTQQVDFEIR